MTGAQYQLRLLRALHRRPVKRKKSVPRARAPRPASKRLELVRAALGKMPALPECVRDESEQLPPPALFKIRRAR